MIETERLVLRSWREADLPAIVAMDRSDAVTRHLGGPRSEAEGIAAFERATQSQAERGHCRWIVERRRDHCVIGKCGLMLFSRPDTPIIGEIEIGWGFREDVWGRGYAKEAAQASLAWGWAHLDVQRIVAITVPANTASWGLMERLGMARRADLDFGHPLFAADHPLHRHITYEALRPDQPALRPLLSAP